jgi:hypothetical protein
MRIRASNCLQLDPVEFAKERLAFLPDDRQAAVLDGAIARGLLNCTRQWGKSTVTAVKAVHRAYTERGSLIVVLSPSSRQSAEFVRKAAGFVRKLGIKPRGDGDNEMSLLFPNGSRIVGLPGVEATVRGFSAVGLLLIDEASRVPDELYKAVRPMLATGGGDLWLMSTPNGKRGFFYDAWARGGKKWARVQVPATQCPRISPKFLEDERRAMGDRWFRQEYMCEFGEAENGVFREESIERLKDGAVAPLYGTAGLPFGGRTTTVYPAQYAIGVDLGQRQDHSAVAVVEHRRVFTGERDPVTWELKSKVLRSVRHLERVPLGTSYEDVAQRVAWLARSPELAGRCAVVMDATGVGAPVVEMVRKARAGCPMVPVVITGGESETHGGGYQRVPKKDLIAGLQISVDQGELWIAEQLEEGDTLLEEMRSMRMSMSPTGRERFGATEEGAHDDLVLAVALGVWWLRKRR